MRLLLVSLAILALIAVVASQEEDKNQGRFRHKSNKKWTEFKRKHLRGRKHFRTDSDEEKAFINFEKVDEAIEKQNALFATGESSFQLAHNELSHLDEKEIADVYFGAVKPEEDTKSKRDVISFRSVQYSPTDAQLKAAAAQQTFDFRDLMPNWVRDQNPCGSCWAFSAAAVIEGAVKMATGADIDVSEQFFLDCDYSSSQCAGGWPANTLKFASQVGYLTERDDPYNAQQRSCPFTQGRSKPANPNLGAYTRGPNITTVYTIAPGKTYGYSTAILHTKAALMNLGPISTCVNASPQEFANYWQGIMKYASKTSEASCNHAVTIVGWGTSTKYGDYWIVKNSWNTWFGDQGYIYMSQSIQGEMLNNNVAVFVPTPAGRARQTPRLDNVHVWKSLAQMEAERAAEIATGCYDSDIGKQLTCESLKKSCGGGYSVTVSKGDKGSATYSIDAECPRTCGLCDKILARKAEIASGCYDSDMGYSWPCTKYGTAYCNGGIMTVGTTRYSFGTECARTCGKCVPKSG